MSSLSSPSTKIIQPVKSNVKTFLTWQEANDSIDDDGIVCVLFAYNEFSEPRFVKVKHIGQIFTMNKCFAFPGQGEYFLCVSTKVQNTSLNDIQIDDAKELAKRNDLLNPLLQKWFYGVSELQKIPTSAVLVKRSLSGERALDNITGYRLIDIQKNILDDIQRMVTVHNHVQALIYSNATLDKWKRPYY